MPIQSTLPLALPKPIGFTRPATFGSTWLKSDKISPRENSRPKVPPYTIETFKAELASDDPNLQMDAAAWHAHRLPNIERTEAFNILIKHETTSFQLAAVELISSLPKEDRLVAFKAAMATGHPIVQGRAIWRIKDLPVSRWRRILLRLQAYRTIVKSTTQTIRSQGFSGLSASK